MKNARMEQITVLPGDFGRMYMQSEYNRTIDQGRAKAMSGYMDSISEHTVVTLSEDDDGAYTIIDGQHRIYAASKYCNRPVQFTAIIRGNIDNKPEAVTAMNVGASFRLKDHLKVNRNDSPWPEPFKALMLSKGAHDSLVSPSYGAKQASVCWHLIMRARSLADHLAKTRSFKTKYFTTRTIVDGVWSTYTKDGIHRTASAICWFYGPLAELHAAERRSIQGLYGYRSMAMAMLTYDLHASSGEASISGRPLKMAELALQLRHVSTMSMSIYADEWVRLLNYNKRSSSRLSIFGLDGKAI